MEKLKDAYKAWHGHAGRLPKSDRYSIGLKVDNLFVEAMESIAYATYLTGSEKLANLGIAMRKLDAIRVFVQVLWELKSLDHGKFAALSAQVEETGKMLGGWIGQVKKQNSRQ